MSEPSPSPPVPIPRPTLVPINVPVGATAGRPTWEALPRVLRVAIQQALGAAVVGSTSQGSGFTPGFASRLRLSDGRSVFVKAAERSRDWLCEAYAREAAVVEVLPAAVPAPRLRQCLDLPGGDDTWLVLVFDDAAGRPPHRPWTYADATTTLTAVTAMSEALTPPPTGLAWGSFSVDAVDLAEWFADPVGHGAPADIADELVALVTDREVALAGNTLVHSDLRDDNVIIGKDPDDTRVWVCDWNWPMVGPVWADAVCVSIAMVGDGLDPDVFFEASRLLRDAPARDVDVLLALLLAYFGDVSRSLPAEGSPYLRAHQRWYATVVERWLRQRRGW